MRLIATDKLKERRKEIGSQEEFVNVIKLYNPKITRQAYVKYELGQRTISMEMAQTIANLLNRPIHKLFKPAEKTILEKIKNNK